MASLPDLSVVVVSWNTARLLQACLASLQASPPGGGMEITVVDNASSDDSVQMLRRRFPDVVVVENAENAGFARANNQGIARSRGRYVLLLNSDTVVPPGLPGALVDFMDRHPEAGACSPRLLRPDGEPQAFAFGGDPSPAYLLVRGFNRLLLDRSLHDWATDAVQAVDWVSGACLMVRREAVDQVGLLDGQFFMYFEDNDWCRRMRQAGWKVYYYPQTHIVHMGGQSLRRNPAAQAAYERSLKYFYSKHYGPVARLVLGAGLQVYHAVRGD